jgi:hypothetical protein
MATLAALTVFALAAGQARADSTVTASVQSNPIGQALPAGFVGVSLETEALHIYTGRDPDHVNPVLIQLLKALAPGQRPVLRIGGRSTDRTWWPMRGVIPPGGITYALTKGWLRTTRALAQATHAKLILGVNLAANRPALAAAEARALVQGIGRRYIEALEIGNEPDLYGVFPWYRDRRNHVVYARSRHYSMSSFIKDFTRWRGVLPTLPLVGPTFAELTWMKKLGRFLSAEHRVGTVTIHRYPLRGCVKDPTDPTYATIPALLSDSSSAGLASEIAPYVNQAHDDNRSFRVDEMNSASCSGRPGVSDTFASALWALDTLFNFASAGVDGVNFHTLEHAPYRLFAFAKRRGTWHGFVKPVYYGLDMFAQAFPTGARLVPVSIPSGPVKAWATSDSSGRLRVVLINKSTDTSANVQLQLPGGGTSVSIERLQAPSVDATSGVTLGGQSFGSDTTTGELPPPTDEHTLGVAGNYSISLPAASAALITP